LGAIRMLLHSVQEKNVPVLEIGWRQSQRKAWIRVLLDMLVPILPFRFLRAGDPIDVLAFAPRTVSTEAAEVRAWKMIQETLGAGVFSRLIEAVPDDHRLRPPIRCQFQLGSGGVGISDTDVVEDWARRLLADELAPYPLEEPGAMPGDKVADGANPPASRNAGSLIGADSQSPRPRVPNAAYSAYKLVVAIHGPDDSLLGTGVLVSGRSLSRVLPEKPVFVTLPNVLNQQVLGNLSFHFSESNIKMMGSELFTSKVIGNHDLVVLGWRYVTLYYPYLSVGTGQPEPGSPLSIVGHADFSARKPTILQGWALEQEDADRDRYLHYATAGAPLSPGSPLIDPSGNLIALHVSGQAGDDSSTWINRAVLLASLQTAPDTDFSEHETTPAGDFLRSRR
jgi:hypothetical protein